jgi:hypothetical protein
MGNNPSKTKRCPECKLWIDAAAARPLSRTRLGGGLRHVCPDCYAKAMALRKAPPPA